MSIKHQKTITQSWENVISLAQKIGGTKVGKKLAKQWVGKIGLVLAGTAAIATPAHAVQINATYSSEMDLATMQAVENSLSIWESELKDPVTLNFNIGFADDLPTGVLAGAQPSMVKVRYQDYLTALGQDSLSDNDILAVKNLLVDSEDQQQFNNYLQGQLERRNFTVENTTTFDLLLDNTVNAENTSNINNGILDNNNNENNQTIWLTRSNAKALGLVNPNDHQLDANIIFSSSFNWDMDSSDGISSNAYDFETVLRHEVGHALGFVSGGDAIEYMTAASSSGTVEDQNIDYVTPLNTYMYSDTSADLGVIDLRVGQGIEKYLSIDGGKTKVINDHGDVAFFSTGGLAVGGDGYQNSHWKNDLSSPSGIMVPTVDTGMSLPISQLDLDTLDLMGWDLSVSDNSDGTWGSWWTSSVVEDTDLGYQNYQSNAEDASTEEDDDDDGGNEMAEMGGGGGDGNDDDDDGSSSGSSGGDWGGWWSTSALLDFFKNGFLGDLARPDMGGGGGSGHDDCDNDDNDHCSGSSGGGWGGWWSMASPTDSSNSITPQDVQSVPEPSSIIPLIALAGLGLLSRKKDK